MMDGRFNVKEQLGTGKQEFFENLRKSMISHDGESSVDMEFMRRETK